MVQYNTYITKVPYTYVCSLPKLQLATILYNMTVRLPSLPNTVTTTINHPSFHPSITTSHPILFYPSISLPHRHLTIIITTFPYHQLPSPIYVKYDTFDTCPRTNTQAPASKPASHIPTLSLATDNCSGCVVLCYSFVSWRSQVVVVLKVGTGPGQGYLQKAVVIERSLFTFWYPRLLRCLMCQKKKRTPTWPIPSQHLHNFRQDTWQEMTKPSMYEFGLGGCKFTFASMPPLSFHGSGTRGYLHAVGFLSVNPWIVLLVIQYHISHPHKPAEEAWNRRWIQRWVLDESHCFFVAISALLWLEGHVEWISWVHP